MVISDKKNAKGLIFAKEYKIPTKVYYLKKSSKDEKKILDILFKKKNKINLPCWIYENSFKQLY